MKRCEFQGWCSEKNVKRRSAQVILPKILKRRFAQVVFHAHASLLHSENRSARGFRVYALGVVSGFRVYALGFARGVRVYMLDLAQGDRAWRCPKP